MSRRPKQAPVPPPADWANALLPVPASIIDDEKCFGDFDAMFVKPPIFPRPTSAESEELFPEYSEEPPSLLNIVAEHRRNSLLLEKLDIKDPNETQSPGQSLSSLSPSSSTAVSGFSSAAPSVGISTSAVSSVCSLSIAVGEDPDVEQKLDLKAEDLQAPVPKPNDKPIPPSPEEDSLPPSAPARLPNTQLPQDSEESSIPPPPPFTPGQTPLSPPPHPPKDSNRPKFIYEDGSVSEVSMMEPGSAKDAFGKHPQPVNHPEVVHEVPELDKPLPKISPMSPLEPLPHPTQQTFQAQLEPLKLPSYDVEFGVLPTPPPPPPGIPLPPPTPTTGGPAPVDILFLDQPTTSNIPSQHKPSSADQSSPTPHFTTPRSADIKVPVFDDATSEDRSIVRRPSFVRVGSTSSLQSPRRSSQAGAQQITRYAGFTIQKEDEKDGITMVDLASVPTKATKSLSAMFGDDVNTFTSLPEILPDLPETTKLFLLRGQILIKHSRKAPPRHRFVSMDPDCLVLQWQDPEKTKVSARAAKKASMPLSDIVTVERGNCSRPLLRKNRQGEYIANHQTSFSIKSQDRTLDLECGCVADCEKWVEAMTTVIKWQDSNRQSWGSDTTGKKTK